MTLVAREDITTDSAAIGDLEHAFGVQRAAQLRDPYPSRQERLELLHALAGMMVANRKRIQQALLEDFAVHSSTFDDFIEILGPAGRAQAAAESLEVWMADDERPLDPALFADGRAFIRPQPKGVIGNIAPWNFPFDIGIGPLAEMFAAGNRVIVKPSDFTPACGELTRELLAQTFDTARVTTAVGGIGLAKHFPTLPWDHLMYTGSTAIGRDVMRAAAENLTPVTLELGGKCPAIITESGLTSDTVNHILGVKRAKNGQICVSVDHVFVPRARLDEFVRLATEAMATTAPAFSAGDELTGLMTPRHFDRIVDMIAEARDAGCAVVDIDAGGVVDRRQRRHPLTLVVDPDPTLRIMTEEIFGPILPVLPYDSLDDVLGWVNAHDRPLAAYIFGADVEENERLLLHITSGGAAINGASWQAAIPSLAFGGTGASGMGRHHGVEGFREFSNPRGVVIRSAADNTALLLPPHPPQGRAVADHLFEQALGGR